MKNNFSIVHFPKDFPPAAMQKAQRLVQTDITNGKGRYVGILKGEKILALCQYSRQELRGNKMCLIHFVWNSPTRDSMAFKRLYQVMPSQYLLECFVRDGYRVLRGERLSPSGKKMVERLKRQEFVNYRTPNFDWQPHDAFPTVKWIGKSSARRLLP